VKPGAIALAALIATSSGGAAFGAGQRRALVIGTNDGLSTEAKLRFAEADAEHLARTLVEVGAVEPQHLDLRLGVAPEEVLRAIEEQRGHLTSEDTLLFFLTGHGGEDGAHLQGDVLGWKAVRSALEALRARTTVAFIDTCQSGAILTAKGLSRGPPLSVSVEVESPKGWVLISSSGVNEISNESLMLQGSPFALSLISGLRGAADLDADARVTTAEIYSYLYSRTLAATLTAPAGPQHPLQEIRLEGSGELFLAEAIRRGPTITRSARGAGACYVLDAEENRVMVEVPERQQRLVALPPGEHVVKCLRERRIRVARMVLTDRVVVLDELDFEEHARELALAKGPDRQSVSRVSLAVAVLTEDQGPVAPAFAIRARTGTRQLGWSLQLAASTRGTLVAGGVGYVLPWLSVAAFEVEVGLLAGTQIGATAGATFGQYVELNWFDRNSPWSASVRLDLHNGIAFDGERFFFLLSSIGVGFDLLPGPIFRASGIK
jgi:hypothetical protein